MGYYIAFITKVRTLTNNCFMSMLKVLLIEDDVSIATPLALYIEKAGHQGIYCTHG